MAVNVEIPTRILIISDTHGMGFTPYSGSCDVAIHCGDLTDGSKLEEFKTTIRILETIDAPLKLIIAGNHDFTLDIPAFKKKVAESSTDLEPELVAREYGTYGEVEELFKKARSAGIQLLDEGTHYFSLENGAKLKVYASPYTPSLGDWGFQYNPNNGHDFSIEEGTDVVITHGPPKGILDYSSNRERAGCPILFQEIARKRPLLHCFGHIHEGWGARQVTWRPHISDTPSHFTDIDNENSFLVENLSRLTKSRFDTIDDLNEKQKKLQLYEAQKFCATSHCNTDPSPLIRGKQTLFVNAAVSGTEELPFQPLWLVNIELPKAVQ
ncbi:putative metallophosphoesterase domain-containing [Phaeomoniella chlamydospora]|uniref:Putative metallophosphoesterase domain-containing n=1 Tax=Phaeomoniella chlamydospora TaxID=158046 RepID=A0A0G2ED26_PHACM|nr:putative metallophosphoesterase domain-containing [Phaeomoniella chlamydospora]